MIECRSISKTYVTGEIKTTVLKDVSFTIEAGEFVAIIGPSGSGKSTLMHILGALDTPSEGHYLFDNQDVSKLDDDSLAELRRDQIGFVFQSFNLLSRASVIRNVMLPLLYTKTPRQDRQLKVESSLSLAGMDKARYRNRSNQLSGGQQQRVAIARALVNDPALILADEPTGNLDSQTGAIVMRAFQDLHLAGRTVVVITHDNEVAKYASRIISIRDGRIADDRKNTRKQLA